MIIEKAILSKTEPRVTNVLWIKSTDKGLVTYLFNGGRWQPMQLVDDKGTLMTGDDEIVNIKDIKAAGKESIYFQDSTDRTDYPDAIL